MPPVGPAVAHVRNLLPALVDPVWDTSALIDDSSRAGGFLAAFTGYRAKPALLPLILLGVYWLSLVILLRRASRPKPAP